MSERGRTCAITGASGYLGSRLATHLEERGWTVVRMGRKPGLVPFALGGAPLPDTFRSRAVDALVHCAYDFAVSDWPTLRAKNVEGSRLLFESARNEGVRKIVHISSVAAFAGCRSLYGKAKLETEEIAASFGAVIARPGLIIGRDAGGIVGAVGGFMRRARCAPVLKTRHPMRICRIDDLLSALARLLEIDAAGAPVTLAHREGYAFEAILRRIAQDAGIQVLLVPVPWKLVWRALTLAEHTGLRLRFRSDNVVSLVHSSARHDFDRTEQLGLRFEGLHG